MRQSRTSCFTECRDAEQAGATSTRFAGTRGKRTGIAAFDHGAGNHSSNGNWRANDRFDMRKEHALESAARLVASLGDYQQPRGAPAPVGDVCCPRNCGPVVLAASISGPDPELDTNPLCGATGFRERG